jgi:hypothetical protein
VLREPTRDFTDAAHLSEYFERRTEELADQVLFDACPTCEHHASGRCGGGCYAFRTVRALRSRANATGVSFEEDAAFYNAVPTLSAERIHFLERNGRTIWMVRETDGTWVELRLTATEQRVLASCNGQSTVDQIVVELDDREEGARAVRRLFERRAIDLANRG